MQDRDPRGPELPPPPCHMLLCQSNIPKANRICSASRCNFSYSVLAIAFFSSTDQDMKRVSTELALDNITVFLSTGWLVKAKPVNQLRLAKHICSICVASTHIKIHWLICIFVECEVYINICSVLAMRYILILDCFSKIQPAKSPPKAQVFAAKSKPYQ